MLISLQSRLQLPHGSYTPAILLSDIAICRKNRCISFPKNKSGLPFLQQQIRGFKRGKEEGPCKKSSPFGAAFFYSFLWLYFFSTTP